MQQAEGEGWLRLGESVVPQCGALAGAVGGAEATRAGIDYHQAHLGKADSLLPGLEISDASAVDLAVNTATPAADAGLMQASPPPEGSMLSGADLGSVSGQMLPGADLSTAALTPTSGSMLPGADMLPGANYTGMDLSTCDLVSAQTGNMLPGADPAMTSLSGNELLTGGTEGLLSGPSQISPDGPMLPGGAGGNPVGTESFLAGADAGHMLPGADSAMAPGMEALMKSVSNLLTNAISGAHPLGLLGQLFEFLFSLFSPQILGDSVAQLAQLAEANTLALMKMKQGGS